jgi:hypothetical protein
MFNNHKMGSSDSLLNAIKDIMEKKHTTPETPKEKSLAKLAHPKDKITHKDVLVGRGVLKKENSGDRMGVIVGTRKEKVELEPKLKEGNDAPRHPITGNAPKGSSERKRKAVPMALGRKNKDHSDWNPRINPQTAALRLGRKLQKEDEQQVDERKLTGAEAEKKEKYVLSMKKKMGGFKQRYGERAKEVMYATATKMAKDK